MGGTSADACCHRATAASPGPLPCARMRWCKQRCLHDPVTVLKHTPHMTVACTSALSKFTAVVSLQLAGPNPLLMLLIGPAALALCHTQALNALDVQGNWRQRLISSTVMQSILRVAVVYGVGAILSDGILTPSISGALWSLIESRPKAASNAACSCAFRFRQPGSMALTMLHLWWLLSSCCVHQPSNAQKGQ